MTKIKASVSKSVAELIVLGFDDQFGPCGARFAGAKPDIVTKAEAITTLGRSPSRTR